MAAREGLEGLAANSLIGLTHLVADFLMPVYKGIREEVRSSTVIMADETPHKMLEGTETANWHLWGFNCKTASYLEAHPTRSGDVPLNFLAESDAQYLMVDGYTGYSRAVRLLKENTGKEITEVYCNAHSIRYFKDAAEKWETECNSILELYGQIYDLEENASKPEQKWKLAAR